jgi:transcriptional regulator with XRE-family HTH domain
MRRDQIAETWSAFVAKSVGDALINWEVARKIGVSDTTVGNWKRGINFSQPNANKVIDFARQFGRPLSEALVAAGYGEAREYAETVVVRRDLARDLAQMSTDELLDAIGVIVSLIRGREHRDRKAR